MLGYEIGLLECGFISNILGRINGDLCDGCIDMRLWFIGTLCQQGSVTQCINRDIIRKLYFRPV